MMKNELIAYTKTNEKNTWSMVGALAETRSEGFGRTRRVLVTIEDAPEGVEHRSCMGCVHEKARAGPCCFCYDWEVGNEPRKNWTAPEAAPVPMTKEYAVGKLEMEFTYPYRGNLGLCITESAGIDGMRTTDGVWFSFAEMAEACTWVNDGTPCAMPAGGE